MVSQVITVVFVSLITSLGGGLLRTDLLVSVGAASIVISANDSDDSTSYSVLGSAIILILDVSGREQSADPSFVQVTQLLNSGIHLCR